ncbi:Na(+)/H(+) antiporter subunit B [Truepera radiovictrix]|uniref:Multisubunit sodium/proton antiporter, MrpB subunit (2.A.63.1) n=1 Tax=Truepera radiovictrix (strain DSM 17093 / CIP 108686 / LMG 22925 / RQ-24) TaxID=649638 RepID=D7CQ16_TRURR|nr:Na(+)/H(+) antiporter subunit B [Truepera radiovictrix]ADI14800.1 multisubunit sodium/proton antiporter, MrpB subunit (2.A.63.1) [Truepera radiovictrix DSM 17093]WMT56649.1 Na(+)/H(+) antiporter subunit B [Truepera radiovictrix]
MVKQHRSHHGHKTLLRRFVIGFLATATTLSLAWAVLELPTPPVDLAAQVRAALPESGVTQPITAVLLNFRSYDTLLEVAVLLIALISVWALRLEAPQAEGPVAATTPVLTSLVRFLTPMMILVAGYLLWAGSTRPGGAFQGGAVLGALGELLLLAALFHGALRRTWPLRTLLTLGFGVFLGVGVLSFFVGGTLLEYPEGWAYPAILAIETLLTVSIGLTLALLFLGADPVHVREDDPREQPSAPREALAFETERAVPEEAL